jgi:hypothetical protein
MSMLQASIRKTGPLGAKIAEIRRQRIAAGLLKDEESQPKEPIVLISENGSKQREDKPQEPRKPVKRRLISYEKPKVVAKDGADHPSMNLIIETVRCFYSVSEVDFLSRRGDLTAITARQMAAYLCKTMTLNSFPAIARRFDGRDHTTIVAAVRRFAAKMQRDPDLAEETAKVVSRINMIMHGGGEVISDATQLSALQMAIDLAHGRIKLNASQRELFQLQIDAIRKRIIEASARRAATADKNK